MSTEYRINDRVRVVVVSTAHPHQLAFDARLNPSGTGLDLVPPASAPRPWWRRLIPTA